MIRAQIKKLMMIVAVFMAVMPVAVSVHPKDTKAATLCTVCLALSRARVDTEWPVTIDEINQFVTDEFLAHRAWIIAVLWEDNILPAMMMMADQLSAVAMQQTEIFGAFLDAKHQMETQRVLQTIRASAHKDYHPSAGMCEFGSSVKSLAASERRGELNAHVMSQRSQDRQLGNANVSASSGPDADFNNRLEQYKQKFCDPQDNNAGLDLLCKHAGGVGAAENHRKNKDIDFTRTVEYPWTLNVDFTDATLTKEEEEVLALANNLYGHDVFQRIVPAEKLRDGSESGKGAQSVYLDARALLAKRSVAENSFNAITSMKSAGTQGSRDFLAAILKELGVQDNNGAQNDILRMLGMDDANNEVGPSYYAQMEVLTKKIYQNPDFYTNLYDKPANVERKRVAMQAIGLIQKFDLFKSYLRNEANLSVLLELAIVDLQGEIENEFSSQPSD
ncbi:MAG: hypothetical protein H6861_04240 [Rhodospirillales bacterium]|nr:hypothetical protein [Rhodospirillales bacterium]